MDEKSCLKKYEDEDPVKTVSESIDYRSSRQIRMQKAVHQPGWRELPFDKKMNIIDKIANGKTSSKIGSDELTFENISDEDQGDFDSRK